MPQHEILEKELMDGGMTQYAAHIEVSKNSITQRRVMITMLRLKNIKIRSEYAEADFFPENGREAGHVVVNLSNGEISACDNVPGYGESYAGHARQRLVRMAKENDNRSECIVMWY